MSLRDNALGELHHNRAGAFAEAQCNYVAPTLAYLQYLHGNHAQERPSSQRLRLLDSCFGLGYNSFALLTNVLPHKPIITAIEIDSDVLALTTKVLAQPCFANIADTVDALEIDLHVTCLRRYCFENKDSGAIFDGIFHDPFSPKKMPQLWTSNLFAIYYSLLAENGFVLTYTCAPAVRGAMLDAGFAVFATTALGGKKGGTLAIKAGAIDESLLLGESIKAISGEQLSRLSMSSRVPYRDNATLDDDSETILRRRDVEQEQYRKANGLRSGR